jgi:lipopolysaccharide/colanic/teichoic acid biosynthesis glycosyltransferase
VIKRVLDVVLASAGLIVLAPLIVTVALALRLGSGRPLLFRQARAGRGGRPFVLYKFRTMREPPAGVAATDAERLTPLGRVLRETSLDELPELWNVLKGDMSLVGPRPLLLSYLERYSPEQRRRHEVRPGITGWAQIHGRNDTTWDERLARDVWYVDQRSLLLDARILLRTVRLVLRREGIAASGHATMPEFRGGRSDGTRT